MKNISSIFSGKISVNNLLIYSAFVSVFLPYYIPVIFLLAAATYLFITKKVTFELKYKYIPWLLAFIAYSSVIALLNKNFNGVIYSLGIFLMVYFSVFVKNNMTAEVFENSLSLCCISGLITSFISIGDMAFFLLNGGTGKHRSTLYFFNCNYLATILAIVVIICAYKFLLHKGKPLFYVITALFCAIAMYLTGSMFVWVEVFVGIAVLLRTTRKHQLLSVLLLAFATVLTVIYFVPQLIPRVQDLFVTTDNRKGIWKISLDSIKSTPFFGRGFMTYKHIVKNYPGAYPTSHSHNILLECLMDFGIIGTMLLLIYILNYFKRLFLCRGAQSRLFFSSLIISLLLSLIAHGTTDLTFLWTQTGFLYCLLMCGIGPEEKLLKI